MFAFILNSQTAAADASGLEIDGLALDVSPLGGWLCLFAVLQSHLVALLQNQSDINSK